MPSERSVFLSRFGSIIYLELNARKVTLAEVVDLICSLPHLETLILKGKEMNYRVPPTSSRRLHLPERLSTLGVSFSYDGYQPFLDWLLSLIFPQQPRLRTLNFTTFCVPSSNVDYFNKLSKILGPSLEVLRCGTFGAQCMLLSPTRIFRY
jgi:hypothetical protein